jgi:glycosyltransferase involved in cell wall biosynthesis
MALLSIVNLLVYFHVAAESRTWLFLLAAEVAEIGLVSVFHSSPQQIALVVVGVAAAVVVLQYQAAAAIYRWSPGMSRLALYEEIGGALPAPDVDLSIVIPSYNGGGELGPVVARLARDLDGIPSEIIVVSDGSTDDTIRIAERAGLERVRVLHYPRRMGKGHALRVGLTEARGKYIAFMDGDGDIDPEGLKPFLTLMELYKPDIVLGSKRHPMSDVHYPPLRRALSWMYHKLGRVLFRVNVRDTQTGLKLIRREVLAAVLPRMLEKRYAFDLELLVVARMLGYRRVFEAPVHIDYRFSSQVDLTAATRIFVDTLAIFYRRYVLDTYRRAPDSGALVDELLTPEVMRVPDVALSNGHHRVLFLNWRDITNPEAGGAEVFTHEVAKQWLEQGHEVSLLTSRYAGSSRSETVDGVKVRRIGRLRSGSFHLLVQRELARLSGFDLVIDEVNTIPFLTPLWHRRLPPVVTLIHQLAVDVWDSEMPRPLAAIGRRIEPRLLGLYEDAPVVTVSESTRDDLCRLGLRNVRVIPIGRDEPPDLSGIEKEDVPTFLFVGRLTGNKRPDHAVEAFRLIRERIPEARLWIVGRGPMEKELRDRLPPGAEMLGYLPRRELYERMARSHCLLVTSVREGWGMVITEANSVGTPAVGYDVPGVRDAILDGETGILAESANPADLGTAAVQLTVDEWAYASIRERAMATSRLFSWQRTADALLGLSTQNIQPVANVASAES